MATGKKSHLELGLKFSPPKHRLTFHCAKSQLYVVFWVLIIFRFSNLTVLIHWRHSEVKWRPVGFMLSKHASSTCRASMWNAGAAS